MPKLEVKYQLVTSANRIPLMANGTIDLECGSTTNNLERQKQVSFTITHFLTANRYVSKKASNIKSVDDLKGKTIVSTSGTTNIKQATELNTAKNMGMNIIPANGHPEAFQMVETGRGGFRDGRYSPVYAGGAGAYAGRLRDFVRCALPARALRHHDAQGRSRVQESRRQRDDPDLQERRDQQDLRQVVHEPGPAQRHQLQRADVAAIQEPDRESDRFGRSTVYK